eukprot:Skav204350  [mRNA]  locus=scaffold3936:128250:132904:- [translate_table: standard]
MGCGASQKYQVSEGNRSAVLSALDEQRDGGQATLTAESGDMLRYKAQDVDVSPPDEDRQSDTCDDLVRAVAAANDEKLLLKYAREEGRPCGLGRGRVFAPTGLPGEPLVLSETWREDAHRGPGALQLSHHLAQGTKARRAWTSETEL